MLVLISKKVKTQFPNKKMSSTIRYLKKLFWTGSLNGLRAPDVQYRADETAGNVT